VALVVKGILSQRPDQPFESRARACGSLLRVGDWCRLQPDFEPIVAHAEVISVAAVPREQSPAMSTNQICRISVRVGVGGGSQVPRTFRGSCLKERLPVTCAQLYSYLNATMGSTFIARRAGM